MKIMVLTTFFVLNYNFGFGQFKTKKYDEKTNLIQWPAKFDPKMASFYVYNEIDINASPETVWDILTDAKSWHTFYKGVEEPVEFLDSSQQRLVNKNTFRLKTMGIRFMPTIKEFVPNERMAWEIDTKKLQAYHAWLIVPTPTGCKLITPEAQNGFLTLLQKVFQPNKLLNLHEHWLEVIKTRAEGTTPRLSVVERDKMNLVLNASLLKFNSTVLSLTDTQLSFRPSSNSWTIAECIEHITLAEMAFPEILEVALQQAANPAKRKKIKVEDDEIKPKMTSRRWKAKSPKRFKPTNRFRTTQEAIQTFQGQRKSTLHYVALTDDDLRNRYWKHPVTGTIDLYQTLLLMSAHLERHTAQIENIKLTPGFPSNK